MVFSRGQVISFLGYLTIISLLVPWISIGPLGIRLDYIVLAISLPILLQEYLRSLKNFKIVNSLIFIGLLIFLSMLIASFIGNNVFYNKFAITVPSEFMQIYIRITAFVLFFIIGIKNLIPYDKFLKYCSFVFIISLLFALCQILKVPVINSITALYATTDNQLRSLNYDSGMRIFGTIGNSLSWGGLCVFFFNYFFFLEKRLLWRYSGVILSLLSVFFSGSKTAIITVLIAFLGGMIFKAFISKYKVLGFLRTVFFIMIVCFGVWTILNIYFQSHLEFILFRFSRLDDGMSSSSTDGRGYQILLLTQMFDVDSMRMLFGVGKENLYEIIGFVEVEFFYILGCYGIIGVILHYLLIYYVVRTPLGDGELMVLHKWFIVVSILSYLIFSLGFYFFRELGAGLYFWILSGYLIGYSKYSKTING